MLWLNILLQSYIFISDAVTNEHIKLLQCFVAVFGGDHFIKVELLTEEGCVFGGLVICRISLSNEGLNGSYSTMRYSHAQKNIIGFKKKE